MSAALCTFAVLCLLPWAASAQALPLRHRLLLEAQGGAPEQVHLALGDTRDQIVVSWAEQRTDVPTEVTVSYGRSPDVLDVTVWASPGGSVRSYTALEFYDTDQLRRPDMDNAVFKITEAEIVQALSTPSFLGTAPAVQPTAMKPTFGVSANPDNIYASPLLFKVTLHNLEPLTQYWYRIGRSNITRSFKTAPPAAPRGFPFTMGVFADVGQSIVSHRIIHHMASDENTSIVLLAGDVTYADGLGARWDAGMRLLEPLASIKPMMACAGNHEIERGEAWLPFMERFSMPHVWSGSPSPLQYTFSSGPVQVVVLNTYAGAAGMPRQAAWLRNVLASIDRGATPWVVAMFHAPMYSSLVSKPYSQAGQPMRWALESLLLEYGVDVAITGHVHAYERSRPVFNNTLNACGPVHIGVGDSGAYGGPHTGWHDPQPEWSAFRSSTFGSGRLAFVNATHAQWAWTRVACGVTATPKDPDAYWTPVWDNETGMEGNNCSSTGDATSMAHVRHDDVWIVRDDQACANKAKRNLSA